MTMKVDFENFSVEEERAKMLRSNISKIREAGWVEDLRILVSEQGVEERGNQSSHFLPGLVDESLPRIYRSQSAPELAVIQSGSELRLKHSETHLFTLAFLPKDKDFVVYSINDAAWPLIEESIASLQGEIKVAKKLKNERAASFKARFEKSS
jgi:hypothetical protein